MHRPGRSPVLVKTASSRCKKLAAALIRLHDLSRIIIKFNKSSVNCFRRIHHARDGPALQSLQNTWKTEHIHTASGAENTALPHSMPLASKFGDPAAARSLFSFDTEVSSLMMIVIIIINSGYRSLWVGFSLRFRCHKYDTRDGH